MTLEVIRVSSTSIMLSATVKWKRSKTNSGKKQKLKKCEGPDKEVFESLVETTNNLTCPNTAEENILLSVTVAVLTVINLQWEWEVDPLWDLSHIEFLVHLHLEPKWGVLEITELVLVAPKSDNLQ